MLVEHPALARPVPQQDVVATSKRHIGGGGVSGFGGRVKTARGKDGRSQCRVVPRPQQVRGHRTAIEWEFVDLRIPRQQRKCPAECCPMGSPAFEEPGVVEILPDEEDRLPPVFSRTKVGFGSGY